MPHSEKPPRHDVQAGIGRKLLADIRREDLSGSVWRDLQDAYAFYLSDDDRRRLRSMNRVRRTLVTARWLLRGLVGNLSPARRLVVLVASGLFAHGLMVDYAPEAIVGFLLLLGILLFEQRDKLLARDELEVGRAVQLALLPGQHPVLPGWDIWIFTRPANDVGGDLLDYLTLEDGHLGLALGDVAGKGLGAALLMSKLQATLRAWATDVPSLSALGSRTNHIFCRDGLPNRFATLTFLRLAPSDGIVHLLNAGHLPPMVIRDGDLEVLPPVALPIGITPDAAYEEQRIDMKAGDSLFVYSDGLSEAANDAGEMFGDARVLDLARRMRGMAAVDAGQLVLHELGAFVGQARPTDDLSLAIIRRLPGTVRPPNS